jgi:predicted ArsR family transcriptional regulator
VDETEGHAVTVIGLGRLVASASFHNTALQNSTPVDPSPATRQSDPLNQPTRARLFALLGELKRPAGTAELAERLGLHPNGVRVHLERLEAAGLVARSRALQTRGRPRNAWTIAADARPGGAPPTGFRELGRWLAKTIPARPGRLREVEAAGREIGRELGTSGEDLAGTDPLQSTLAALGFQPRVDRPEPGRATYCLGNCPYRDAVRENQAVVCTLHRGITRGLLDVLEPGAKLVDFVPRDPDTAGCLIEVTGVHPPITRESS